MRFAELCTLLTGQPLLDEIRQLLELKMQSGEADSSATSSWQAIPAFIEAEINQAQNWPGATQEKLSSEPLDTFLREAVLHFSAQLI